MILKLNRRDAETQRTFENGFCQLAPQRRKSHSRFPLLFLQTLIFLSASVPLWFKESRADEAPSTLPLETQTKIEKVLAAPGLKEAHVGISILDLGAVKDASTFPAKPYMGKLFRVLFERDADKRFMPASNMKLFTAAIALQLLGKDRTFPTRVFGHGLLGLGRVGALRISGGGDPSLSVENIEDLARQLKANKVFYENIIVSEGMAFSAETFDGKFPFGWTLDDTKWYYGPQISALAINRNQLDLTITGGDKIGDASQFEIGPSEVAQAISIVNDVQTGSAQLANKSLEDLIEIHILIGADNVASLKLTGQVAPKQVLSDGLSLPVPEDLTSYLLLHALQKTGNAALSQQSRKDQVFANPQREEGYVEAHVLPTSGMPRHEDGQFFLPEPHRIFAQHNSPPLKVLFQRFLKNSDNLYAEMLLRDAAYYYDGTGGDKAGPRAHELLKQWLIAQNIDVSTLRFEDGSGLSRYNLLTPRATSQLLAAINRMKDGDVIWDALPIAGVDGTMKNRLKSTPALGNVRAKSGTFSIASNLSGYVTTRDNHRLAVALYINFARDTDVARSAQDAVFGILADASWKAKP